MLENCLCPWISDKLYKKRNHLRGGKHGNGFEMWRRMRADYNEGGGVAVRLAGVGALNTFPKFESANHIGPHLDGWEDFV